MRRSYRRTKGLFPPTAKRGVSGTTQILLTPRPPWGIAIGVTRRVPSRKSISPTVPSSEQLSTTCGNAASTASFFTRLRWPGTTSVTTPSSPPRSVPRAPSRIVCTRTVASKEHVATMSCAGRQGRNTAPKMLPWWPVSKRNRSLHSGKRQRQTAPSSLPLQSSEPSHDHCSVFTQPSCPSRAASAAKRESRWAEPHSVVLNARGLYPSERCSSRAPMHTPTLCAAIPNGDQRRQRHSRILPMGPLL
jgi:hypothetical protein